MLGWGTSSRHNGHEAQEARARLAPAGAFVDEHGRVEVQASDKECAEGPWRCDLPLDGEAAVTGLPRKLASRLFRHVETPEAHKIWREIPEQQRTVGCGEMGSLVAQ